MAKIDLPYQISNDSPANATPVQSDLTRIEQHINAELIERGGTVAMAAQLRLVGNPVNALDAAPKQYVDTIIPVGGIMMFGGTTAPAGGVWLLCDGAPYQSADYPALFAVIGTRFGGSAGFFNVPPMVDRTAVGGGGKYVVGAKGGSSDAQVPTHTHPIDHGHGASSGTESANHTHASDHYHSALGGTAASAGDHWHQPSNAGEFVIGGQPVGGPPQGWTGPAAISNVDGDKYGKVGGTGTAGAHAHTISGNTNYMSQTPGQGTNTGTESVVHSHTITVNGMSGASGPTGVAVAEINMPPYVGVSYLIRAA